jgi:hypothetical protein
MLTRQEQRHILERTDDYDRVRFGYQDAEGQHHL